MTVDSKVRGIMSWIGNEWSQCLYNGISSLDNLDGPV